MTHRILTTLIGAALLAGCATERVQPWERDVLARQPMQLDAYPLDTYLDEHIYFSKEGASGGQGIGGGGCGCN
ncbi:MAG: hypothetical protein A2140_07950 [Candidatus Muproteobacteria bacterium RBG_16_62_13]|uniref:DUF4266 domain-containing protein n=1 Tax=Candidatus Muproteobacteria bacterium RBG_16_62_13 TaxID=1817756 RepID=A0A1F6T1K5_9PROT|nr:MAG: hypothetical protein A2140_07950 [Candidatus Muproteobacteria bacterium RBG_16_62_13]